MIDYIQFFLRNESWKEYKRCYYNIGLQLRGELLEREREKKEREIVLGSYTQGTHKMSKDETEREQQIINKIKSDTYLLVK